MNNLSYRVLYTIFFLFITLQLTGIEALPGTNPWFIASSGLTGLTENPANTLVNPATGGSGFSASTSYLYEMVNLHQSELSAALSYDDAGIFAGWQTLNDEDYQRDDYRMGFLAKNKYLRLGGGIKLCYDHVSGYGSSKANWAYAGARFEIAETTLDASLDNINLFTDTECPNDRILNLCLGQGITDNGAMAAGIVVVPHEKPNFKFGCRYNVYPGMQAILSWESDPGRFGLGTTYNYKIFDVIYAVQTHPELSWTHSLGLSVRFR